VIKDSVRPLHPRVWLLKVAALDCGVRMTLRCSTRLISKRGPARCLASAALVVAVVAGSDPRPVEGHGPHSRRTTAGNTFTVVRILLSDATRLRQLSLIALLAPLMAACGSVSSRPAKFPAPTAAELVSAALSRADLPHGFRRYSRGLTIPKNPGKANGNQGRYYVAFDRGWRETAQDAVSWVTAWDTITDAHRAARFFVTAQARKGMKRTQLHLAPVGEESGSYLFAQPGSRDGEIFIDFRVGRMVGMVSTVGWTNTGLERLAITLARRDVPLLRRCRTKCTGA
jgi:hypothetical protein